MTDPMTTDRLAEIEARYPRPDRLYTEAQIVAMGWRALDDVPALLTEVRRLQDITLAIAAKAWDEGYAEGGRGRIWDSINPYQTRADHIERGES